MNAETLCVCGHAEDEHQPNWGCIADTGAHRGESRPCMCAAYEEDTVHVLSLWDDLCMTCGHKAHDRRCEHTDYAEFAYGTVEIPCWCVGVEDAS
jgi:hypothetical protein